MKAPSEEIYGKSVQRT